MFSDEGIVYIQDIAKKVYKLRTGDICDKDYETCRIGHLGVCQFIEKDIVINFEKDNIYGSKGTYFHFNFTENYLVISSNELDHEEEMCFDPPATIAIPWLDIIQYVKPIYRLRIYDLVDREKFKLTTDTFQIKNEFVNLQPLPEKFGELSEQNKQRPYLISGDQIEVAYYFNDFARINYKTPAGKIIHGWIRKDLLE